MRQPDCLRRLTTASKGRRVAGRRDQIPREAFMPSHVLPINRRVLTVVLIVTLPLLVLGARYVVASGQDRVRAAESLQLAQVAEYIAASTDGYIFRRIVDVAVIARVSEVRRAAQEGSRQPLDKAQVDALDQAWQKD